MQPQYIGRYKIIEEIGRGGMATVYLAYDPQFDRQVAIKALPREFLHDPTFQARFEREARTIAKLEHPAIVPVHDSGEDNGQPYLVLRYMPGGSLAEHIHQSGALPLDEVIRIISTIAPALDKAHSEGIVHRDLKPSNILFDEDNNPYLTDFGIAKLSEGGGTLTGSRIIGTPAYMSPEQAQGEGELDHKSDIYSLGIIIFEMLSGSQPFVADTPMRLAMKHIMEPVPQIDEVKADLPSQIQDVLSRALSKEPTRRFASASDLAKAYSQAAAGELKLPVSKEDLTYDDLRKTGSPQPRKKANLFASMPRWSWLLLGVVVIGGLVGGLMWGSRDDSGVVALEPLTSEEIAEPPTSIDATETAGPTRIPSPEPTSEPTELPSATNTQLALETMPDVIDLDIEELIYAFANADIPVEYLFKLNNEVDPGTVINQIPVAGEDTSNVEQIEITLAYNLESIFNATNQCPGKSPGGFWKETLYRVELQAGGTYQISVFSAASQDTSSIDMYRAGGAIGNDLTPLTQSGNNLLTYYIEETTTYVIRVRAEDTSFDCIVNVSRQIYPENMDQLTKLAGGSNDEATSTPEAEYTLTVMNNLSSRVDLSFYNSLGQSVGRINVDPNKTLSITLIAGTYTVDWHIRGGTSTGSVTGYLGFDRAWVISSEASLSVFP